MHTSNFGCNIIKKEIVFVHLYGHLEYTVPYQIKYRLNLKTRISIFHSSNNQFGKQIIINREDEGMGTLIIVNEITKIMTMSNTEHNTS